MVSTITKENINEVMCDVIKKLDDIEMNLACPGCETDEIGHLRCEALRSIQQSKEIVRNVVHKIYTFT